MIQQTESCQHPNCHCPGQPDTGYCSDYCANAINDPLSTEPCGCDHPECETTEMAA